MKHCSCEHRPEARRKLASASSIGSSPASSRRSFANFADEIAYNNHDVDDGIRAGLISIEELRLQVPLFSQYHAEVRRRYPDLDGPATIYEILRRMINHADHRPDR